MKQKTLFFSLLALVSSQNAAVLNDCVEFAPHEVVERLDRYIAHIVEAPYSFHLSEISMKFKYDRVRDGFNKIVQEQSLASLQTTWENIKADVTISSDHCEIAEFAVVLILAYSAAIKHLTLTQNRVNWLTVIALYAQLNNLPLARLFDVLEECLNRYQDIMNAFPKDEQVSWLDWSSDFWWVPMTLLIFTVLSFARWYKAHMKLI